MIIIGGGLCGLRVAIETALLGARTVVVEKRDRFSRNNVLHLWPFLITDLKNLGAKKFFGKFCAGAIDHISKSVLYAKLFYVYEPQHDKTNKVAVRPAKTQISLGICPV